MDEILKYHRVQGKIRELLTYDKIRSVDIGTNVIAIGTEEGNIHVLSLDQPNVATYKVHDRPVNDISMDSMGILLASCSDNGSVVMQSLTNDEEKSSSIHFNEPIKAIVVDNDENNNRKKEKSIILGTSSGKLIHHKQVWFTNKNVTLFNGTGSPVISITWRGDIVAWADLTLIRLMHISTQAAICFVNPPAGVGLQNPFPCHFFWESDTDLFIAWADNARHIEIQLPSTSTSSSSSSSSSTTGLKSALTKDTDEKEITARVAMDYQLDCIACGISSFDMDHLLLFGYIPPDEDVMSSEDIISKDTISISNQPEVKIMKRSNGQMISCDTLPMQGQVYQGPWDYHFLSSFMCPQKGKYSKKWQVSNTIQSTASTSTSSSDAKYNLSPFIFLFSPNDLVIAKVRDVNDRIGIALQHGDLLVAANLAMMDKVSLHHYQYHDIIALYLDDLLEQYHHDHRNQQQPSSPSKQLEYVDSYNNHEDKLRFIASEVARLIGADMMLWERWINTFMQRNLISSLLPYIPTHNPRLASATYELILEYFYLNESMIFLSLVEQWGRVKPVLFQHDVLIQRLESSPKLDPYTMEGLAQLYLWSKKYEKALTTYLDINYASLLSNNDTSTSSSPSSSGRVTRSRRTITEEHVDTNIKTSSSSSWIRSEERANFIHVFELIEIEKLFDVVHDKIINLFRLSKELSVSLLTKHVEHFPIANVVKQLRVDKRLLNYYLHYLFTKYEAYNNDRQYAEFHIMQVSLYAEYAPKFEKPVVDEQSPWGTSSSSQNNFAELIGLKGKNHHYDDSEFMTFLRASKFYPLDYALRECEKRKPPLYYEMVYILDLKGLRREALNLLLREIGDMRLVVDFIERHEDHHQAELWNDLVDYSIKNHRYLSGLLEYLGICNLNAVSVVSSIPAGVTIPALRQKILRVIKQYHFQVFLNEECNMILEEDALDSLKRLKQGQRKAMKVNPGNRCNRCAKPLFMNPGRISSTFFNDCVNYKELSYQIWGVAANNTSSGGVVVFSPRVMFHRQCFDELAAANKNNSTAAAMIANSTA